MKKEEKLPKYERICPWCYREIGKDRRAIIERKDKEIWDRAEQEYLRTGQNPDLM